MLFAYRSKAELESYAATDRLMSESFDCPARRLDPDELVAMEPRPQARPGGRLVLPRRRPSPARQAHDGLASGPREGRGPSSAADCPLEGFAGRNGRAASARTTPGRAAGGSLHRRHRRLDAEAQRAARLSRSRSSPARDIA